MIGVAGDPSVPGEPSIPVPAGEVAVTELASGRRVVTDHMPGASSATLVALVGVGGRDEPAPLAGVSHFLEHLLCKGSADRPAAEVAEVIDERGGDLDAVTDRERTAVQVRVPARDAGFALELLGDLVLRPAVRGDEVDLERRVILEELAQAEEDPEDRAHALAGLALYGDHPLGREVLGDRDTLTGMGPSEIRAFHSARYRPTDMVVAAAGGIDHDSVVAAVRRWDEWAGPATPDPLLAVDRTSPGAVAPSTRVLRRAGEQVHIVVGWPLGPVDDGDRPALGVIAHILGGGPASRLFRSVRDERGLAYAVDASLSLHRDAGALTAYAGCSPTAVAQVRDLLRAEVERLATHGPSEREVQVATGYLSGASTLALEDSATRAWRVAIEELERGGARPAGERIATYRQVTVDQARAAAERLAVEPSTSVVGPVPRRLKL
ncbi:MAG: M16 family metallopeptidase [Iamia sp.]